MVCAWRSSTCAGAGYVDEALRILQGMVLEDVDKKATKNVEDEDWIFEEVYIELA